MRVSTPTLLTIYEFGRIMGLNPWELAQVGEGFPTPNSAQCPYVWYQYSWQQDFLSREELASTIYKAEEAVAEELGYWPAPKYFYNEKVMFPSDAFYYWDQVSYGIWKPVSLRWKKINSPGLLARTALGTAAIVLSDTDGDGINDRFTATIATTLTDTTEIGIYFTAADRNSEPVDETWRIRPVKVSISGGFATITGFPSLLIKPDLTTITNPVSLNVTTASNYVTQVEVYRVYTDTVSTLAFPQQGLALWEVGPCDTPPCSALTLPVCVGARDTEQGVVWVDFTQGGTQAPPQYRNPDRLSLNYCAGVPLADGQMQRTYAEIVAHLAAAWLPVGSCGCDRSDRILNYWRQYPSDERKGRIMSRNEMEVNPFGSERGAIYAYKRIQMLKSVGAVSV